MKFTLPLKIGGLILLLTVASGCPQNGKEEPTEVTHKIFVKITIPIPKENKQPAPETSTVDQKGEIKQPPTDKKTVETTASAQTKSTKIQARKKQQTKSEPTKQDIQKQGPRTAEFITIQVSSFRKEKRAENEKIRLEKKLGTPIFIHKVEINNRLWFRVYVGRFNSKAEALKMAKEYKNENVISYFRVVRFKI